MKGVFGYYGVFKLFLEMVLEFYEGGDFFLKLSFSFSFICLQRFFDFF